MKKLGLIGGMGPESTIPYYHDIVYGVQEKLEDGNFPMLTIESVNVFDVLKYCADEKYDELIEYLLKAVNNVKNAGADFAALSANTPHIVFDELQKKSPIPLLSIIDALYDEVKKRNMKKVGLLGTCFTMEGNFFKKKFIENNIEVIIPDENERKYINEKISKELELGIVKEETLREFINIVDKMIDKDEIDGLILGCTELPLLFKGVKMPVQLLDTMEIHIKAIVDYMTK